MSRQTQNLLLGGLASVVAVVAMVAATLLFTRDEPRTAAIEPLAEAVDQSIGQVQGLEAGDGESASPALTSRSTLAIAVAAPSTSSSTTSTTIKPTTTTSSSSTTAAPTTTTTEAETTTTIETTVTSPPSSTTEETDSTKPDSSESTKPESTSTTMPSTTTSPAPSTSQTTAASGGLNSLEQEIARLTNELRTNPNGSLKRLGPVPNCNLRVDRSTGTYESLAPVAIHKVASLQVSRPWSAQMTRNLQHQPQAGGPALAAAGIQARSYGENISFNNYPDKAMKHFTGWRESDGHFCNMMSAGWTHLGVGEVTKSNGDSFATQNFFILG